MIKDLRAKYNFVYKNRIMTQLTTKMANMWKAGVWKYSYTNFNTKCKGFLAVSGRYFYLIDFIDLPQKVSFSSVPKTYRRYLNPKKNVYKIRSRLVDGRCKEKSGNEMRIFCKSTPENFTS